MPPDHHNGQLRGHGPTRDFKNPNQQTSPDTHAPRVSLISVTRDLLDKPTGGVTGFGVFLFYFSLIRTMD